MSTQNVNVARFARIVEWDFFCDFQTPCLCTYVFYSIFWVVHAWNWIWCAFKSKVLKLDQTCSYFSPLKKELFTSVKVARGRSSSRLLWVKKRKLLKEIAFTSSSRFLNSPSFSLYFFFQCIFGAGAMFSVSSNTVFLGKS